MRSRSSAMLTLVILLSGCGTNEPAVSPPDAAVAFSETYVPVESDLRLYARVVGKGADTVIIPAGMYLAHDLAPLARGRTLIFYDPRGRGGSDVVLDPARLGVNLDVADLEAVRAHFHVERASIIGWSYLGAVVALYAAEHPERVARVVQIGPAPPRTETSIVTERRGSEPAPADLARLEALRKSRKQERDPVGYCREWLKLQLLPSIMGRPEAVARTRMDPCIYWNEWPTQVFRTLGTVWPPNQPGGRWDFTARAALVQAPVLIVHGTRDPSASIEGGRNWAALLPHAQMVELEGVGHAPWLEAPDRFFTEVDAFLRRR